MYTQCDKCKAIFEVSMREVTVASGKLRCGECNAVFDVMATLSTTMPEPYSEASNKASSTKTEEDATHANVTISGHSDSTNQQSARPEFENSRFKTLTREIKNSKWLNTIAFSLAALLLAQVLYSNRHYFSNAPIHAPDQIQMISNNVFAHPNEEGVLLISASIENIAEKIQYYPILEVSLTDSKSNLVALRRFEPSEYLEDYNKKLHLDIKKPVNLKLKIADPGNDAVHFKFDFL